MSEDPPFSVDGSGWELWRVRSLGMLEAPNATLVFRQHVSYRQFCQTSCHMLFGTPC
jgi:hypothetical protein